MEKTARNAPPYSVRYVSLSSELHRTAPGDVHFGSKDEVTAPGDGLRM